MIGTTHGTKQIDNLKLNFFSALFEDDSLDQESFQSLLNTSTPNIPRLPEATPNIQIESEPTECAETKTEKPDPESDTPQSKPTRKTQRANAGKPPARYPNNKTEPKKEEH